MKKFNLIFTAVVLFACISNLFAQDWPQFLGPDRNSTSPQKGILRTWPATGPEVLWTASIGVGYGGPVIKDGKAYLLDRDDKTGDIMRCFDMKTGKEIWKFAYEAPMSVEFPGSRSVPAVDDKYVYSCGHNGDLYCFDIKTYKPVWIKNVWTDFGGQPASKSEGGFSGLQGGGKFPVWAIAQCPLIYGNMLIIASQAPEAGVVAYNKLTGDVIWKTANLGAVGFVSPSIAKINGEDQVVMITASSGRGATATPSNVVGINPKNGAVLWTYSNWSCWIPSSSAFDAGKNRILIVGGYNAGAAMIQIEKTGDKFNVKELYKTAEFGEHTKPPIFHNGYFYAQFTNNERKDGLVCMSEDGKIMWKTMREPLFDKGSMILADGVILATDGIRSLYVIEPSPEGFKPLATAEVLKPAETTGTDQTAAPSRTGGAAQNWAPLALSNGMLLVRDKSRLMCVKVAQ
ncbi:MAG: PQQ-binding-like beta-propeller repeat protein [Bacteroidales bacterium]|nr:PQQ-binding-like beta-propeller repeat protein [Bacteroidales bacterium]MBK7628833.1 PQQ-binding-like beta-propeller repeat protein [Bacteroidales bacterium]